MLRRSGTVNLYRFGVREGSNISFYFMKEIARYISRIHLIVWELQMILS